MSSSVKDQQHGMNPLERNRGGEYCRSHADEMPRSPSAENGKKIPWCLTSCRIAMVSLDDSIAHPYHALKSPDDMMRKNAHAIVRAMTIS
jgi:hypothetical protein